MELKCIYPALPKTERGKFIIMGADPNGENVLYTNDKSVIIRGIKNITENDIYTQHSHPVNVAKYSPSHHYICSGDKNGKIKIWSTHDKTHVLKNEFQPFGGSIIDLCWSSDSKRIFIGGQGREQFATCILADTGSRVGEIMGISKSVNSVDIKPTLPAKLVAGTEENSVVFFDGYPVKFKCCHTMFKKFCNVARYSPDGKLCICADADGRMFSFNAETSEFIKEIPKSHNGGIYSLSFSPKGKYFITASADKTLKLWKTTPDLDVELVNEYAFENHLNNMLVGCVWSGEYIVAASLKGYLYVFEGNEETLVELSAPKISIHGHNNPITCSVFSSSLKSLVTGSLDASIMIWPNATPTLCNPMDIVGQHTSQINAMATKNDLLATVGIDDKLIISNLETRKYIDTFKLDSQPKGVAVAKDRNLLIAQCINHLYLFDNISASNPSVSAGPKTVVNLAKNEEASCVDVNADGTLIVVGFTNGVVRIYRISKDSLEIKELTNVPIKSRNQINDIKFSPCQKYFAMCDVDRYVQFYELINSENDDEISVKIIHEDICRIHTARVNKISWHSSSKYLASGSLDCSIIIWRLDQIRNRIQFSHAHPMNQITGLHWDGDELFSTGQDGSVKVWKVSLD